MNTEPRISSNTNLLAFSSDGYRRMDEIGTPYCVTVDYQTLEDQTVTVRFRDSMRQERVSVSSLVSFIRDSMKSYKRVEVS